MKFSQAAMERLEPLLKERGIAELHKCDACKLENRMNALDHFLTMPEAPSPQQLSSGVQRRRDFYVLSCTNCGNTKLFDRLTIGYPPGERE